MFTAKSRESAKTKAEGISARPKSQVETADRVPANAVWHRLATRVQAKLKVSAPDDPYEREADRVADQVMGMPEPVVQRACPACAAGGPPCLKCQEKPGASIHRKRDDSGDIAGASVPDRFVSNLGPGQPLDAATRGFMERRFGQDFRHVRVHTGASADTSARSVNALAYAVGEDLVFGEGQYRPWTNEGQRLLAHELAHVVQQSSGTCIPPGLDQGSDDPFERAADLHAESVLSPHWSHSQPISHARGANEYSQRPAGSDQKSALRIQRQKGPPAEEEPLESDDALIACLLLAPLPLKSFCFDLQEKGKAKPGGTGSPAPAPGVLPPSPPPPPPVTLKMLNFYHGTRWSIAKTIPNDVKPIGGGDFAAGFYTHHDQDDSKALKRAVKWGTVMANKKAAEPYAGVVRFGVQANDYRQLFTGGKGKGFDLTTVDQPDFKEKQKAWLDFITSTGRKKEPVFKEKRGQWVHERREPQPSLTYNIVEGPFYTPLKGTKGEKPAPEEFKPYAEGKQLPQQVTWANEGIKLLNSSSVVKELKQYDAKTGKPQDPPIDKVSSAGQLDAAQISEATEEAQMEMAP